MKHVHAEVIKAWADGAEIQCKGPGVKEWYSFRADEQPGWFPSWQYRVKPKDDVVVEKRLIMFPENKNVVTYNPCAGVPANIQLTFDGETGALKKAEVI
jgi:hypothetical protein